MEKLNYIIPPIGEGIGSIATDWLLNKTEIIQNLAKTTPVGIQGSFIFGMTDQLVRTLTETIFNQLNNQETQLKFPFLKTKGIDILTFVTGILSRYAIAILCNTLFKTSITTRYVHLYTALDCIKLRTSSIRINELLHTKFSIGQRDPLEMAQLSLILIIVASTIASFHKLQSIFTRSNCLFKEFFYFAIIDFVVNIPFYFLFREGFDWIPNAFDGPAHIGFIIIAQLATYLLSSVTATYISLKIFNRLLGSTIPKINLILPTILLMLVLEGYTLVFQLLAFKKATNKQN